MHMQMAQYADSINFDEGELSVKVIRCKNIMEFQIQLL